MTTVTEETARLSPRPARLAQEEVLRTRTLWRDAARRFRRNRLAMLGLVIVLFIVGLAIFADILAPYPYAYVGSYQANKLPGQLPGHILGTDGVGRDYLSRLIYGARTSMIVGLGVQVIAFGIGMPLGALSGWRGGLTDFFVQRLVDVWTAFPGLLFAIFLARLVGSGVDKLILVVGITAWVPICRLTRAQILSLREKEFIEAARAIGATPAQIFLNHLLPNAISPLLIALSFGIPLAIFAEAGLGFLGLGVNEPLPSWGKMVGGGLSNVRVYWHLTFFPTVMIALTMLGFSFVGDGLQVALNPQAGKRV